ncbi:kinesin-like protein KIF24 isoform X2 [Trachinotus anak]
MGVHHAAHLSALTMEDYPILGIRTMEDRTRLFHLVQMVKTLDLEGLGCEDGYDYDDYGADGGNESYAVGDSSFIYDGHEDPDEDVYDDEDEKGGAVNKLNSATFARPSRVCRRLDFSCETFDHHQKLPSRPVGSVHACASHNRNDGQVQSKGSATPLQLKLDSGSAVVYGYKGNHNHRTDVHSCPSNRHTGGNTKPHITGGTAMYSHTRLSPKFVSFHKQKPRPATAASKRFDNKPGGHKDKKRISKTEKLNEEIGNYEASGRMAKPTPVYESKRTAGYNYGLPQSSPPASNKKQEGQQRISVCVRKRPLTHAESRRGEADVVTTSGGECVIVHESKEAVDLTQYILQHRFYFDKVFGEESSNEEVYQRTAYPLVQHMLSGGKATCFAYGQTGAGKTHTMLGSSPRTPGLYALAAQDIFAHLSTTYTYSPLLVYVSFFEIYCGQLYDLLDRRKRLFAREDGEKVVHIAGLLNVRVDSVSSLLEVISQGTEERTQGMSGVNPLSSRSHALLQIQLRGPNQQLAGRMWFVDLAGSERASDTKEPDRQSRMEGAEINQSLLALKECIRSLDQEQSHTPFRQSKLTQVLKDSFVGDSMTCMIANISPGHSATEHTLNTLRYADRVKELRGQGGLRGGRRGKTIPSPKHNLSNSNSSSVSSVGTRGKSPPKKQKLGRQREGFSPTILNTRLPTGNTVLCSTPKSSRWEAETSARHRKGIGLEHITPVRGWLGMGDKRHGREGAAERKDRRENESYRRTNSHSIRDQNARAGQVLGWSADEQLNSWGEQESLTHQESGICHREKENQHHTVKGGREEKRRWIQQQRQVESSGDACSEVERLRERELKKVDERDKEKQRHLRRYHQQLQQFMPSSAFSSVNLLSPSAGSSFSSSCQASCSPSVSASNSPSLRHSSHFSASGLVCLEEVLDMYKAGIEVRAEGNRGQLPFPSGEMRFQIETPPNSSNNNDKDPHGDSGGVGEDLRLSWEGTEAKFEQDRGESDKRRSMGATGEARVRKEDWAPAGMEGEERRWAWMATTETEQTDRMTGAILTNVVAQMSCGCHLDDRGQVGEERLDSSDVPADGVWRTEEEGGADSFSLVSTHSNNDSNSLLNNPPFGSPNQRAPAERPLSPACEHIDAFLTPNKLSGHPRDSQQTRCTSNILPLPLQNTKFSNSQSTTVPHSTSITQTGYMIPTEALNKLPENAACTQVHKHPEVKAKMMGLPQDETYADSLSYITNPLSISLLKVDQQVATASFLQGEQNTTSVCVLENERGEDNRTVEGKEHHTCAGMAGKVVEEENKEFHPSLLKTHCPPTFETMTAVNHTERGKGMCCATYEHHGIGGTKPPIPEVVLVSLQDQENSQKPQARPILDNNTPATPHKPSTCASMQTSVLHSISPLVQHSRNTDSSRSISNGAAQMPTEYTYNIHNKPVSSISTLQSESVFGQCRTVHSNHSSTSNNSLQPNSRAESNGQESTSNQQIRPIIHLSASEDLDHAQWSVVQAHWAQLEEMEDLCHKEGTLLCQQPDMTFGEYVNKLGEIMERKALCLYSMRAQLQPFLKPSYFNQLHNQGEDNKNPVA